MFSTLLLIIIMFASIAYLILVFNSKYYWLNMNFRNNSISLHKDRADVKSHRTDKVFLYKLGLRIANLLPKSLFNSIKKDLNYLARPENDLYESLSMSLFAVIIGFFCFIVTKKIFFIIFTFFILIAIFLEISFSVKKAKTKLADDMDHILQALKILLVKTETPISNALEIILEDLPEEMIFSKREIEKLLIQASKTGLKETLFNWQTDVSKFRDFVSLLISCHQGTNRLALKFSFDSFLSKIDEEKKEKSKAHAENLQLYLMGPVVLMLLVVMLPMLDAITNLMNNSGVF